MKNTYARAETFAAIPSRLFQNFHFFFSLPYPIEIRSTVQNSEKKVSSWHPSVKLTRTYQDFSWARVQVLALPLFPRNLKEVVVNLKTFWCALSCIRRFLAQTNCRSSRPEKLSVEMSWYDVICRHENAEQNNFMKKWKCLCFIVIFYDLIHETIFSLFIRKIVRNWVTTTSQKIFWSPWGTIAHPEWADSKTIDLTVSLGRLSFYVWVLCQRACLWPSHCTRSHLDDVIIRNSKFYRILWYIFLESKNRMAL